MAVCWGTLDGGGASILGWWGLWSCDALEWTLSHWCLWCCALSQSVGVGSTSDSWVEATVFKVNQGMMFPGLLQG